MGLCGFIFVSQSSGHTWDLALNIFALVESKHRHSLVILTSEPFQVEESLVHLFWTPK